MHYNEGFGSSLPPLLLLLKGLISWFSQLLIWCLHILNIYFIFDVFLQKNIYDISSFGFILNRHEHLGNSPSISLQSGRGFHSPYLVIVVAFENQPIPTTKVCVIYYGLAIYIKKYL
jgi:hypothetical protein